MQTHAKTLTHNGLVALLEPLKWSVTRREFLGSLAQCDFILAICWSCWVSWVHRTIM